MSTLFFHSAFIILPAGLVKIRKFHGHGVLEMKVAIVTGGGGGIGRATALALADLGYALVLAGRTPGRLNEVAEQIKRSAGQAIFVPTDVTKPEEVDQLVRHTMGEFARIDALINTAGMAPMISTPDILPTQWREILEVNLSAAFYLTRAVWPVFRNQHLEAQSALHEKGRPGTELGPDSGGVIVHISSESARDPFPGLGAYGVAKAALNMLTKVTAQEGEPLGIRVVGIAPAAVETPMFRAFMTEEQVPTTEILAPQNVAEAVVGAVTGAMRYASGETIFIHRRV